MSEIPDTTVSQPPAKEDPEMLVLRGRPRPAVRFRRGLIVGIIGATAAALITLSWIALEPPSFRKAAETLDVDEPAQGAPDALANTPKSYADVPHLGAPLPGDLGRPILEQQILFPPWHAGILLFKHLSTRDVPSRAHFVARILGRLPGEPSLSSAK